MANRPGWEVFAEPTIGGVQADLFYAGPDGPTRDVVEKLISDIDLRPIWVGGLDLADVVDGLLLLWLRLAARRGRRIAFKLLTEGGPA